MRPQFFFCFKFVTGNFNEEQSLEKVHDKVTQYVIHD